MYASTRIDDVVTTDLVVAEPVGDPDLDTDEDPGVELKEVALISAAYNVVVIKNRSRCAGTEYKCIRKIPGICAAREPEYRLLEKGLGIQFERIGEVIVRLVNSRGRFARSLSTGNGILGSAWRRSNQSRSQRE